MKSDAALQKGYVKEGNYSWMGSEVYKFYWLLFDKVESIKSPLIITKW